MRNDRLLVNVISLDADDFARKVEGIDAIANSALPGEPVDPPIEPPVEPPARTPWFQVGTGEGKKGETVEVSVLGGCTYPMDGFHVAGGCGMTPGVDQSGYGNLVPTKIELGSYLSRYLTAQGVGGTYFESFQWVNWKDHSALPEEWWQYGLGFFSMQEARQAPPIPIPPATELFRITFKIPDNQKPGPLTLTCRDNYYYTQAVRKTRDLEYTFDPQGFTAVECINGEFLVIE